MARRWIGALLCALLIGVSTFDAYTEATQNFSYTLEFETSYFSLDLLDDFNDGVPFTRTINWSSREKVTGNFVLGAKVRRVRFVPPARRSTRASAPRSGARPTSTRVDRQPTIPVLGVNNPDGRELIEVAKAGRPGRLLDHGRHRLAADPGPGRGDPGRDVAGRVRRCSTATSTPGTSASATTPPATRRCWSWPASSGSTGTGWPARCGSPGGAATRTGATPARPGTPTPSRIDLARGLRRPGQLRLPRLPLGDDLQRADVDERGGAVRRRGHPRDDRDHAADRSGRRAPATTPSTASASASFYMLTSTMSPEARDGQGLLPGRRLRRQHRLAHRGRHAGDRRPRQPAARHAGLRRLAAARAQRAGSTRSTGAGRRPSSAARSTATRRRPATTFDFAPALEALDALDARARPLLRRRAGRRRPGSTRARAGSTSRSAGWRGC